MWIISVAPMPSMTLIPVSARSCSHTSSGMCSPALTAPRRPCSRSAFPALRICRYAVGAVASTVTPASATNSASGSGATASVSSAHAPARRAQTTRMPRPNVNASGAVQETRSSGRRRSVCRPKVLSIDRMSRWKCVVIFGTPVLPEVGPKRATSSAAVSTAVNSPDFDST